MWLGVVYIVVDGGDGVIMDCEMVVVVMKQVRLVGGGNEIVQIGRAHV